MRVTTLGSLNAVAPYVSSQGSLVGLGDATSTDTLMTAKHVAIFATGVLVGALGTHFIKRRRR